VSGLKYLRIVWLSIVVALALSGCAVKGAIDQAGNTLDSSQLGSYAVAEVGILKGPNSQQIEMVDRVSSGEFCKYCRVQEINLKPGVHQIVIDVGFDASHQLVRETFNFPVEAGNRYTLLEGRIAVTRRDDPEHLLYTLVPIAGRDRDTYYPPAMIAQYNDTVQMQRAEAQEQRVWNQPLVRKIGAHICKEQGAIVYAGYVEQIADDKVQIRVASAAMKQNRQASPAGFQPNIIWDSPSNWDLCE